MSFDNDAETSPEARAKWFTTTHWSVVLAARGSKSAEAEVALEQLCRVYWYPLYAYVRRQGNSPHDAQDLTQEFFARLLEKNYLSSVEREKGKFRSFLLASLNHFLSNQRDRAAAAKRGGGQKPISLDERTAEERYSLEPATTFSPEDAFEKRWAITLLEQALDRVRAEFVANGKGELFEHLKTFLAEGTGSGESKSVAAQLGMTPNGVAVAVHRLRKTYREAVRAEIAQTVASPDQIEDEMRHLLAALV